MEQQHPQGAAPVAGAGGISAEAHACLVLISTHSAHKHAQCTQARISICSYMCVCALTRTNTNTHAYTNTCIYS
jgi:hypothetical protein